MCYLVKATRKAEHILTAAVPVPVMTSPAPQLLLQEALLADSIAAGVE